MSLIDVFRSEKRINKPYPREFKEEAVTLVNDL